MVNIKQKFLKEGDLCREIILLREQGYLHFRFDADPEVRRFTLKAWKGNRVRRLGRPTKKILERNARMRV